MIFSQKFFFIFNYLFIFFPFLLISGPFLSDFFVILLSIYCVFFCYLNKKFFFFKKKLIIFFITFYFYININSFFSYSPIVSFATSLPYVRMILFSVFTAYLLEKITKLKKVIFFSIFFSYLILFFDSIFQLKTGTNILGLPIIGGRISSFFGDKLVMGSYVTKLYQFL